MSPSHPWLMFTTLAMWIRRFDHACRRAGLFYTSAHTVSTSLSRRFFPPEVSFPRGREVMQQRGTETWHTPAWGEWRLIKSPGFPESFLLGRAENVNALPHLGFGSGRGVVKWWTRGTHHHRTSSKHECLPFFFFIRALWHKTGDNSFTTLFTP